MGRVPNTADKAAKAVGSTFSAEFGKIGGAAGAMSSVVGGSFGQLGSLANSAVKPLVEVTAGLSGISGGLVAVAGSAGLAVGAAVGVVGVVRDMADAALAARDRLQELGVEIDAESTANLQSYQAATADLAIAYDQLQVAVGGELAGDLAEVASAAANGIRHFIAARDAVGEYTEFLSLSSR